MKPNQLVIEAFGPYATRAEVDFDALADTRLFVVSGPTGAGKTSIFDAMCWALYGELPGNRLREGKVRSDAADPRHLPPASLTLPAAAFLDLALSAARTHWPDLPLLLTRANFLHPLFLPHHLLHHRHHF